MTGYFLGRSNLTGSGGSGIRWSDSSERTTNYHGRSLQTDGTSPNNRSSDRFLSVS